MLLKQGNDDHLNDIVTQMKEYIAAIVTCTQTLILAITILTLICYRKRSFLTFPVQLLFWWLICCFIQGGFNVVFVFNDVGDIDFGFSGNYALLVLFSGSNAIYFCVFFALSFQYYKNVDAINNRYFLSQIDSRKKEIE